MILFSGVPDKINRTAFLPGGFVHVKKLQEEDFDKIPILRQVISLCHAIQSGGKLKLTATGNLPMKVVREMYELGIKNSFYEKFPRARMIEQEAPYVGIAREVARLAGIIRKKGNELYLTKKGEKLLGNKQLLLESLLVAYAHKFDLSRYDNYNQVEGLGSRDIGISLIIFEEMKEVNVPQTSRDLLYAQMYFVVCPEMDFNFSSGDCYIFRTYNRFMNHFGLVTYESNWIEEERRFATIIHREELFDRMIGISDDYNRFSFDKGPDTKIFTLQISLNDSKPKIWRRVRVPSTINLYDLHVLIQLTMGWENSHLHEFEKDKVIYSDYINENFDEELKSVLYFDTQLSDLIDKVGDQLNYTYDFGDYWQHTIALEAIEPWDENVEYPVFVAGERRCPPEDCGGIFGFYEMLEILNSPNHPEREEYIGWLGGPFDPEQLNEQPDLKF